MRHLFIPFRQVIWLVLLTIIISYCTTHNENMDIFSGIRPKIQDFMQKDKVPSVSVAVAQFGKILWEESFGWANREKQVKATPNTMYEIASIAKVFTTTGLMILKERGEIELDEPVITYLDDIKIKSFGVDVSGVTLRRIVQHTSGLPMYWGEPSPADTNQPFTQKDLLNRFAILAFKPGQREIYSNLGIGLLTYTIEKVSKQSYNDFLQQNILRPLGMKNTLYLSAPALGDEFAQQYDHAGNPWIYEQGLYASAHDLLRFGMFHLKDHLADQLPVLSDSTIDLMQTSIDALSDFRLPWWVWEYKGYKALVFTGASGTIVALLPEADLAIVVLSNRLQADTPRICGWIADVILDNFNERQRKPTQIQTRRKTQPGALSRKALTGLWKGSIETFQRALRVELSFSGSAAPQMRSMKDDSSWMEWVESMPSLRGNYSGGIFSAYFPIHIPVSDTRVHDHWTWIYIGMEGDTLQGYAVAHAADGPNYGLPYLIRLERAK